jgi:hypothetical protein
MRSWEIVQLERGWRMRPMPVNLAVTRIKEGSLMRFITALGLFVAVAMSVTAMAATASDDSIEPNTDIQGYEHFTVGNVGNAILQVGTGSSISCNQVLGEGTIYHFTVGEGSDTEIGALEALDFLQSGNQKCPATGLPVSSCNPTVNGFLLDLRAREATNELYVANVEVTLACESFIGTIDCHYTSPVIDGTLSAPANEVAVFGSGGLGDDILTGEASNSFICAASAQFRASLTLTTEASATGGAQEIMLTEVV